MVISLGCDHTALALKDEIVKFLRQMGYEVNDYGTFDSNSCDYPDYGIKVAQSVSEGIAERGIVICYTGIGMSIIANKVKKVRCALVDCVEDAELTRLHNDSNVLALSAKRMNLKLAKAIIIKWLDTPFSNEERHRRRIEKITRYEEEH